MPVRSKLFSIVLLLAALASAQESAPRLPYVDQNRCPGEGCIYRDWNALANVPTFDTWRNGRKRVGTIRKGQSVVAVGGLVVTARPGVVVLNKDMAENGVEIGRACLGQDGGQHLRRHQRAGSA